MFQDKFVLADGTALQSNIVGVNWTTSSNSDSDIAPGSVCASAVEIEFWVNSDSALSVTQGTVLTYYKVDIDFDIETKIGVFTCDKPEKTGANKYKVTAYDNVTLLDVDVSEWLNALTFPITIKDFATALAAKCGLELANEPRLNKDYQVQKFTGSGVKARDLMKMVCSASGCFCNADANGKLFFDWYKKNEKVVIAPRKSVNASSFYLFDVVPRSLQDNVPRALVTTESGNDAPDGIPYFANQLTFSDFVVKVIDKVQVRQSDDDVGVIYPADEQGTNALVIQGNQLLSTTSDAALRPYVKNLYDGLNNITYVPCSNIQTPETLEIKVGDIVTVSDGKKEFVTWITSVKHSGGKCTFESVGNANRNTTTAVNNAQYNARQKMVELKASVDGISAKLSDYSTTEQMNSAIKASASEISATVTKTVTENIAGTYETIEGTNEKLSNYYTKLETETAITANLDKIELGISEKIDSTNFMGDSGWNASTGSVTTGSVTITDGVATIVAPDNELQYIGATSNMPISNLAAMKGASVSVSVEYKVNTAFSVGSKTSKIALWAYYASGNVSTTLVTLSNSETGSTEPVGDWKTAKAEFSFKGETPTRVYFFAYTYGGTGSVSVRNPSISYSSSKTSVISLTKSGTVISASELNLNEYAKTAEVNVAIDSIKLGITQENTYADVDLGSTTWTGTTTGASVADGVLTLNHIKNGLVYGVFALPKSARNVITAHKIKISLDYRVTSELDARSYVTLYVTYADGTGIQKIIATICNATTSVPVSDWKTVSYEIELESKDLSKVEITPTISSGTTGTKGSYQVKNVAIQYVYSYANKFELTKDGAVLSASKTASTKAGDFVTSAELNVKTDEITATVVKDGEVRSKFALDSSNCTITSGIITFNSNSLVVNSDNFKLTRNGTVTATGSFTSITDSNSVILGNGQVSIERKLGDGSWRRAATLIGYGSNDAQAQLQMYANNSLQVLMQSSFTGGELYMYHTNNVVHTEMKSVNGAGSIWLRYSDGRSLFHVYNDPDTGRAHVVFDGELECKSIKRNGQPV